MRLIVAILVTVVLSSPSWGQSTVKLKQATIFGHVITVGQGADIVQSRIKADRFVSSGYSYGDPSKGYYTDKGVTYIVTYGPPKGGSGAYVVRQIEKVTK